MENRDRTAEQAHRFEFPLRQIRGHPRADGDLLARAPQLLGHEFVEALPRRIHDQFHSRISGDFRALLRHLNRAIQPPQLIHQAVFFGLPAGPNAALCERVDLLRLTVAGLGDLFDELIVEGLELSVQLLQLLGIVRTRRGIDFRVPADAG